MTHHPLIIVGGGPAGMAAAIEAARAGLSPTLLDDSPRLGGQVYRQPPEAFQIRDAHALGKDFVRGERLRAEFAEVADRVELRLGTSVLGISSGREVLWASGGTTGTLHAEQLIAASGAYDRPVPFPGWTLPGVMTAGAVQTLLKTMHVRPSRRALVAGTGPLLLGVAQRLAEAGVEVAAVLEAGNPPWATGSVPDGWRVWDFAEDVLGALEALHQAGVPLLVNHTVFAAHGRDQVERASFGPVDAEDWRPLKDRAQAAEVDLVVTGFGFVPNTELTELAGCRHQYAHEVGGWTPVRDPLMQTTVPGVFAVGDGAGIRGPYVAVEEGRVAGITAAERARAIPPDEAARRREAPLDRLRSLAEVRAVLDQASWIRPGLLDIAAPETLVCRCEEVTLAEVRSALDEGARDLQAVKLLTRLGMGSCQGRNCAPQTGMYLCRVTGRSPADVGRINPRQPVKPVTLGALAAMVGVAGTTAADPLDAVGGGAS